MSYSLLNLTTIRGQRTTNMILSLQPRRNDRYLQRLHAAARTLKARYADREFEYVCGNDAGSTLWRDTRDKLKLYFVEDGKVRQA